MFLSKTIVAIYWLIWPFLHWPWPPLTANEYLCDGTSQSQVNPCHIANWIHFVIPNLTIDQCPLMSMIVLTLCFLMILHLILVGEVVHWEEWPGRVIHDIVVFITTADTEVCVRSLGAKCTSFDRYDIIVNRLPVYGWYFSVTFLHMTFVAYHLLKSGHGIIVTSTQWT